MWRTSFIFVAAIFMAPCAAAQEEPPAEIRTRNLWNEAFVGQRPAVPKATPASPQPMPPRPGASVAKSGGTTTRPRPVAPAKLGDAFVGLTLWNMKKATGQEPVRMRGLSYPGDPKGVEEWSPERAAVADPINHDQYIRLSIESARKGYLYVIDRDRYADGTLGQPHLIFPTSRLRGGDNRVEPGLPLEIPGAADEHPAFRVDRSRPDQLSIDLVIIVAPVPIPELTLRPGSQNVSEEQVARWEKAWGARVERIDAPQEKGKLYTSVEHSAAKHGAVMTAQDPIPATLFHCQPKAGDPMLVRATLTLAK